MPDGLWMQCDECNEMIFKKELEDNLYTCPKCNRHFRIGSSEYIDILFDPGSFIESDAELISTDPLEFVDEKPYTDRIKQAVRRTGLSDAMRIGVGRIDSQPISF